MDCKEKPKSGFPEIDCFQADTIMCAVVSGYYRSSKPLTHSGMLVLDQNCRLVIPFNFLG